MSSTSVLRRSSSVSTLTKTLHPYFLALLVGAAGCGTGTIGEPGTRTIGGNGGTASNGSGQGPAGGGSNGVGPGASGGGSTAPTTPGAPQLLVPPATAAGYDWYDGLEGASCSAPSNLLPAARIWRLSATQWANTAQQALGITGVNTSSFPGDEIDAVTGFSDNSTDNMITQPLATAYFSVAGTVATSAAPVALAAYSCLGASPITASCGQQFVADYGAKLFRRALTSAESAEYSMFLAGQSALDPSAVAVASTLQAMLLSPNFEYRTELGSGTPGPVTLTGNEIAALLSYSITDSPPDAELIQAAAAGTLTDATVRETEARRLMALPAAQLKLADFWQQYLSLDPIPVTADITQPLATAIIQETETFFNKVVWAAQGGTFNDLLTAQYTYADPLVAALYGTAMPAADGTLMLPAGQRSGFLTQASVLIGTSAPSQAATVIHRGLLVRERLLCETPGNPPPNFLPNPAMIMMAGANATALQNYQYFAMTMPSCNGCHLNFQPLGLSFETYDTEGHYRAAYPAPISQPIVVSGTLTNAGDAMGPYTDVIDMASKLGPSKIGQYCFTDQFAQYALGRSVDLVQEACTVRTMGDFVTGNGGAVRELFTSLAHVDTAFQRFYQ
jgi:Protein of unknown function (DUF1592)/Protein of unknown function (DUF1588)/Protein of unknown function (DUF1595)/Protein of unknown function (DUF1587)